MKYEVKVLPSYPAGMSTSFHDDVVKISYKELKSLFGDNDALEEYCPGDKTHIDYVFECTLRNENNSLIDKFYFTIYDYRQAWSPAKVLYYHIGAKSKEYSRIAVDALKSLYNFKVYKEIYNSDTMKMSHKEYKDFLKY